MVLNASGNLGAARTPYTKVLSLRCTVVSDRDTRPGAHGALLCSGSNDLTVLQRLACLVSITMQVMIAVPADIQQGKVQANRMKKELLMFEWKRLGDTRSSKTKYVRSNQSSNATTTYMTSQSEFASCIERCFNGSIVVNGSDQPLVQHGRTFLVFQCKTTCRNVWSTRSI
jgi:hypothetical protein